MRADWCRLPFDDVIADESGGNVKTPQSEFLSRGPFPVVDQGKDLVAGYVDDELRLCRAELPVIVFGDHTRCFKYVDFPFCMGADGIKVLRPRIDDAEVKYLYHYLRTLRLANGGYERHYKFLKRTEVVLPPLAEQRRIAEVLDRAEALRNKRRAALAHCDTLAWAIFLDTFGDPATNPMEWPEKKLGDIAQSLPCDYGDDQVDYSSSVDVVKVSNIDGAGEFHGSFEKRRFKETKLEELLVREGELLVVKSSGSKTKILSGKTAVCGPDRAGHIVASNFLLRLRVNESAAIPRFVWYILNSRASKAFVKTIIGASTYPNLKWSQYSSHPIALPPITLQREFASRVSSVERLRVTHRASLTELDALFASLQHRAFRGEL